jgi:uncharacterized protein YukE
MEMTRFWWAKLTATGWQTTVIPSRQQASRRVRAVASGGFEVTFGELDAAAAEYLAAAQDLKTVMTGFQSQAKLSRGDFGRLSSSPQMDTQYQTFYNNVMEQMHALYTELSKGGGKLAASAASYKAAEDASTGAARTI